MAKKKPKEKPDWVRIAEEYVQGGPDVTLAVLAENHTLSLGTVQNHCAKENWVERRQQLREEVVKLSEQKKVEAASTELVQNATSRQKLLHRAFEEMAEASLSAFEAKDAKDYAVSAGIYHDKLLNELGFAGFQGAGESTYTEEITARRTWVNKFFAEGEEPYVVPESIPPPPRVVADD